MRILATALAVLFACPAQAAICFDPAGFAGQAARQGKARVFVGLTGNQSAFLEMFANDATGSWTLVVTTPSGRTCIAASGEAYELTNDTLPPAGEVN